MRTTLAILIVASMSSLGIAGDTEDGSSLRLESKGSHANTTFAAGSPTSAPPKDGVLTKEQRRVVAGCDVNYISLAAYLRNELQTIKGRKAARCGAKSAREVVHCTVARIEEIFKEPKLSIDQSTRDITRDPEKKLGETERISIRNPWDGDWPGFVEGDANLVFCQVGLTAVDAMRIRVASPSLDQSLRSYDVTADDVRGNN